MNFDGIGYICGLKDSAGMEIVGDHQFESSMDTHLNMIDVSYMGLKVVYRSAINGFIRDKEIKPHFYIIIHICRICIL